MQLIDLKHINSYNKPCNKPPCLLHLAFVDSCVLSQPHPKPLTDFFFLNHVFSCFFELDGKDDLSHL